MNPKVARFFPLGLGALTVFRELLSLIFYYEFNPLLYVFQGHIDANPRLIGCLIALAIRALFVLGCLYLFKLYSEDKLDNVIPISALLMIHLLVMFTGGSASSLGQLIMFSMFLNLLLAIVVKQSNQAREVQPIHASMPAPVPFNPPVQSYSLPGAQSVPDQLAALEKLHISGVLSDTEFKAAKKKVLE